MYMTLIKLNRIRYELFFSILLLIENSYSIFDINDLILLSKKLVVYTKHTFKQQ